VKRIYVNEEVCIGCGLCQVYCQVEQSQSKDLIKAFKKETPRPLPRVRVERNVEVSFPIQCRQCAEPWCVYSCLTGAMHRDPVTGMVSVDMEKCIGCWTCIVACPYGAIKQDKTQKKVLKCDLCQGEDIPVCVTNCPNEALVYAEVQDESLTKKARQLV
jgi:carbon-monoxide dehydrogenase iron sulfur subunit